MPEVSRAFIRNIVREELNTLGNAMRPGGDYELSGYDPDYETQPARLSNEQEVDSDEIHPELQATVNAGETLEFEFVLNITVTPSGSRAGVIVSAPGTPGGSSAFTVDGVPYTTFNTSVASLANGVHHIAGVLYSGAVGFLGLRFAGPPDDAYADLVIVFTTLPQQIEAGVESEDITIQRLNNDGVPLTDGALSVDLASTSPEGTFSDNPVTIPDGSSEVSFTYTDETAGNPVISATGDRSGSGDDAASVTPLHGSQLKIHRLNDSR